MLLIFILYALFASSFVISKKMLAYTSPIFLVALRMLIGGSILIAYQLFYKKEKIRITTSDLKYYALMGICGIYISYTMRYWSLAFMTTSKAYFLYKSAPFFTALLSYYLLRERLSGIQWLSIAIGFIGLLPILIDPYAPLENCFDSISRISIPELIIILSIIALCLSKVILRKFLRIQTVAIATINGITMLIGGFFALLTALLIETPSYHMPLPFFGWLALSIVISNIICYNLYAYLLKKYTATFLSLAGFSSIFFAVFYGWLLFGETITAYYCASALIVGIALLLFYREESKKNDDQ